MLKEFKTFAMRGNVIDLAVGVVIGAAFGKITNSLVNDILMPILNPLLPGGTWREFEIGPGIRLGSFVGTVIDFLFIAFAVFMLVKAINRMKKKEEEKPAGPAELPPDVKLLTEIRDLMKEERRPGSSI
jgi:large conductance mechanosensitive channel